MMAHPARDAAAFEAAAAQLRAAGLRRELQVREIAAPERIAPRSVAFAADVAPGRSTAGIDAGDASGDSPYGAGRLILIHDPASAEEWGAPFRIVCFAQAPLEMEIGIDPFIADVAWSWLIDALDSRGASYTHASGTATKTLSTGFGTLEAQGDAAQIEIRASWTPLETGAGIGAHAEAWGELLCLLAGLPHQEGVASLSAKRASRGASA